MTEELKPCPFCGVRPKMVEYQSPNVSEYAVECENTQCVTVATSLRRKPPDAAKAWNTRRPDPLRDRLSKLIDDWFQEIDPYPYYAEQLRFLLDNTGESE